MMLWNQAVEILRESIFAYSQACNGNLGNGILAVTFLARLALLPLALRLARGAAEQQRAMARLQPALDELRKSYSADPRRLADETRKLMAREGVSPLSLAGSLGGLAQMPIVLALYSAVRQAAASGGRFLWIRSLAAPDWPLAIAAALSTVMATAAGPGPAQNRWLMLSISAAVTMIALSKMAAGIGLYWAMSSLFGAVQGWAVQRSSRTATA